jgi:hypothetical protein
VGWDAPLCAECGLYAALDAEARAHAAARVAHDVAAERRHAAAVARLRNAVLDRSIAVPLHMLEAFNGH